MYAATPILHQIIARNSPRLGSDHRFCKHLIYDLLSKIWRTWQINIVPGGDDAEELAVVKREAGQRIPFAVLRVEAGDSRQGALVHAHRLPSSDQHDHLCYTCGLDRGYKHMRAWWPRWRRWRCVEIESLTKAGSAVILHGRLMDCRDPQRRLLLLYAVSQSRKLRWKSKNLSTVYIYLSFFILLSFMLKTRIKLI